MSNSFKTLGFAPQLEKLIEVNGFTSPTPIQMKAIPLVRQGYDLLAAAQTGTGKTAAFVLPMLQKIIEEPTLYQKRVPRVFSSDSDSRACRHKSEKPFFLSVKTSVYALPSFSAAWASIRKRLPSPKAGFLSGDTGAPARSHEPGFCRSI